MPVFWLVTSLFIDHAILTLYSFIT